MVAILVAVWLAAAALARVTGIWIAVGGAAVLLGATLLALDRATLRPLLRPTARAVLAGAAAGAAMIAATQLLASLVLSLPGASSELARLYGGFRAIRPWAAMLVLVPIIAGEELVWRGVVQARCAQRLGAVRAVPLAAALYAVAHAPFGSWMLCLAAAGCGLVWSALAARTRGLAAPFIAHLAWDLAVLFVVPLR